MTTIRLPLGTAFLGLTIGGFAVSSCADPSQSTTPPDSLPGTAALVFSMVAAGDDHTCALTPSGGGFCWGGNEVGQLGAGTRFVNRSLAGEVVGGHVFVTVRTGAFHSCALTTDGTPYCWGFNVTGQLGDGSRNHRSVPTRVAGEISFTSLDAGGGHSCGVTDGGVAYCWGLRGDGRQEMDSTTYSEVPVPVDGGLSFVAVGTGGDHRCGTTPDRVAYCWGAGSNGRLGTGVTEGDNTPVRTPAGRTGQR